MKQGEPDFRFDLWNLWYDTFSPPEEPLREVLCGLGNGMLGVRTAQLFASQRDTPFGPGTYQAGLYNTLGTKILDHTVWNEDFVNCPDALQLRFRTEEGGWFHPPDGTVEAFHQKLSLQEGIVFQRLQLQNKKGQTLSLALERLVHMGDASVAAVRVTASPVNFSAPLEIHTGIDGTVKNDGVERYRSLGSQHWIAPQYEAVDAQTDFFSAETSQSRVALGIGTRMQFFQDDTPLSISPKDRAETARGARVFVLPVTQESSYTIEKMIVLQTRHPREILHKIILEKLAALPRFSLLHDTHTFAWKSLWEQFDCTVEGDDFVQFALRFHLFHLLQTASPNTIDQDVGLPARGLTGEAYRGHIFWDEVYAMHFFDRHDPAIARSLLHYRFHRLPAARKLASEAGFEGAMFPWQSASTGEETSQQLHLNPISKTWGPDLSAHQRHVSFAIAFNTLRHWQRTGDDDFWRAEGEELFFSILPFAASLVHFDKSGRAHTRGLMGPDEFHEALPDSDEPGLPDNAYSNLFIVWLLREGLQIIDTFSPQKKKDFLRRRNLSSDELLRWEKITKSMHVEMKDGVLEQFAGYFDLEEIDWDAYRKKYGSIGRMDRILKAEGKSPDAYKVSKQADVLMLFYLFTEAEIRTLLQDLGFDVPDDFFARNYDFYFPRTSHGSTLSLAVHARLALQLGRKKEGEELFQRILQSDLCDTQGGTTPEGIHVGVMAASVDLIPLGFANVDFVNDTLHIDPHFPSHWKKTSFRLLHRGEWFSFFFDCTQKEAMILCEKQRTVIQKVQTPEGEKQLKKGKTVVGW